MMMPVERGCLYFIHHQDELPLSVSWFGLSNVEQSREHHLSVGLTNINQTLNKHDAQEIRNRLSFAPRSNKNMHVQEQQLKYAVHE